MEYPNHENWWPDEREYNPGISEATWIDLVNDSAVFDDNSLIVMKCILDYGGAAACKELAEAYGRTKDFYNLMSSQLAKRVHVKTGCKLITGGNASEDERFWPVLYTGKFADKNHSMFIYRLRPELKRALIRMIVRDVGLSV